MSRIASIFPSGHKALIAYTTVGYPNIKTTSNIVPLLHQWGCDMVELGIPFSDPIADGVTIQKASQEALKQGVSVDLCLNIATRIRERTTVPLVFMTYYNPVFNFGLERFCHACQKAEMDGLIIPDLPPEEARELETLTQQCQLDLIYLLAPNSSEERIELVAGKSQGFIYLVSVTGVTGARERLPVDLENFVLRVRGKASQPLCVGFGISTSAQGRQITKVANGIIVGSRLIQLLEQPSFAELEKFIRSLRKAL